MKLYLLFLMIFNGAHAVESTRRQTLLRAFLAPLAAASRNILIPNSAAPAVQPVPVDETLMTYRLIVQAMKMFLNILNNSNVPRWAFSEDHSQTNQETGIEPGVAQGSVLSPPLAACQGSLSAPNDFTDLNQPVIQPDMAHVSDNLQ